jgi:hypothetical protein
MKNNTMYRQTKYIIKNIQCRLEKKAQSTTIFLGN